MNACDSYTAAYLSLVSTLKHRTFLALYILLAMLMQTPMASASMMYKDNGEFAKATGLPVYEWLDDAAPPKAIVILLHGFTQQALSPQILAEHLAREQCLVISMDLRGHGRWCAKSISTKSVSAKTVSAKSKTTRKAASTGIVTEVQTAGAANTVACALESGDADLLTTLVAAGAAAQESGFKTCVQHSEGRIVDYYASVKDLKKLCLEAREKYPGIPLYCIGESMGSAVAARAARENKSLIDGLVLGSPGSRPLVFNVFWVVSDFIKYFSLAAIKPVVVQKYISKYASNDSRIIDEMVHDPLSRNKMSLRELLRTLYFVRRTPGVLKHINPETPVLMVQGKQDHIVSPRAMRNVIMKRSSPTRQIITFPENGHVMLGTSFVSPDVIKAIDGWLDVQIHRDQLSLK